MHITLGSKTFYEVDFETDVQNLSTDTNFFYVESIGEPPLTGGYITDGYILEPLNGFKFENTGTENCWLYNPSNIEIEVQI